MTIVLKTNGPLCHSSCVDGAILPQDTYDNDALGTTESEAICFTEESYFVNDMPQLKFARINTVN